MSDPRFSLVVPVHRRTEKFLNRCLGSVFDQRYTDYEIIVVQDGPCETVEQTVKKYAGVKHLTTNPDNCLGACVARNMGWKQSSGDVLLFFDSDSYLEPGAFDLYLKALRENPNAAFVYSGYKYTSGEGAYPSAEFDSYQLETANYVSTMSPIRRRWFKGFDENLKSLQDWDVFLGIAKAGGTGVFIPDFLFVTELPAEDGVSADSHQNWLDRVEYIKRKHGVPIRDINVCSLGAPQHALRLAKLIGADCNQTPWHKPNRYRLQIQLGFYGQTSGGVEANLRLLSNSNPECKMLLYWIGEDITQMRMVPQAEFKPAIDFLKQTYDYHFVEYEGTRREVEDEFGIPCTTLPLPVDSTHHLPTPYPEKFTVAFYHGQAGKYRVPENIAMASQMPDIQFAVFGNSDFTVDQVEMFPENVKWNPGRLDMNKFMDRTTCLLRTAHHDGFCVSHCEWVLKGRYVVSDLPYRPGAMCVPAARNRVMDAIRDIQELCANKTDPDEERLAMREQYAAMLDPKPWIARMEKLRG
jgi:glycosyltransferase involved in cell wall biosynthesis